MTWTLGGQPARRQFVQVREGKDFDVTSLKSSSRPNAKVDK